MLWGKGLCCARLCERVYKTYSIDFYNQLYHTENIHIQTELPKLKTAWTNLSTDITTTQVKSAQEVCSVQLSHLVISHKGCRLTPGQMSFHGRNEDVWPNPLFSLIKMDISELSGGEVWVFRHSRWQWASFPHRFNIFCGFPSNCVV